MSFNKVIIVGNLGKDPVKISKEDAQSSIAAFSIATHETTNFNGKVEKVTEWFDVVCFGSNAEFALKYLKKGREVLVEGKLQAREYNLKDGTKVKAFEIKASTVQALSKNKSDQNSESTRDNSQEASVQEALTPA